MTQQLAQLELVRAWQNYFRIKGGESPRAPADILPVIQFDDNAAFPPYRAWYSGHTLGGTAAVFSYLGWQNTDAVTTRSVMVIDEIAVALTGAADLSLGIVTVATLGALGATAPVQDRAEEKDQQPTDLPAIGNVIRGSAQWATGYGNTLHPGAAAAGPCPLKITGPFAIGPQAILVVRPTVQNIGITAYAVGRYYPAL